MKRRTSFLFFLLALLLQASTLFAQGGSTVRYYISQVVVGPDDVHLALFEANPRPNFSAKIPTLPNGQPAFTWGIAYAVADDWSGVDADPRNIRLFAGAEGNPKTQKELLDTLSTTRWDAGTVTDPMRAKMRNLCIQLGISVVDISPSITLRQVLRKVGTFLQPDFDETKLSVQ